MPRWGKKWLKLSFTDFSSGENSVDSPLRLGKAECRIAKNAMVSTRGVRRRPGSIGFATAAAYLKMLHSYIQLDGTDTLLTMHGGILYSVNVTTGALTQLYDIGGSGEGYAVNARDKCWVCNGTDVIKVENNVAYPVGIAAPTGVTATGATSGGSLADGTYKLYACYARGSNLFSIGQSITDVTITGGGGAGKITIASFANSSDSQVNKKIIFMTNANGAVYYHYDKASAYADTTWVIDDTADADTTLVYSSYAATNYRPPAFEYILEQDNRIWGSLSNVLYYSLKGTTVYELERFNTQTNGRKITFPFAITGLFSIGSNLYINTEQGIYMLPESDPLQKYIDLKTHYYWYAMKSIVSWSGGILGLTQDGVRFFDGTKFYPHDITAKKKDVIARIYSTYDSNKPISGCIHRTKWRSEYHLVFCDSNVNRFTGNSRLVLNIDTLAFHPNGAVSAAWETWENGANYTLENSSGVLYSAQSHETLSSIYNERDLQLDINIYRADRTATYDSSNYDYQCHIQSATVLPSLSGRCTWLRAWVLAVLEDDTLTVNVSCPDTRASTGPETVDEVETFDRFDASTSLFGTARFAGENASGTKVGLDRAMSGKQVKVDVIQNGNNQNFELLETAIEGILTESRFT